MTCDSMKAWHTNNIWDLHLHNDKRWKPAVLVVSSFKPARQTDRPSKLRWVFGTKTKKLHLKLHCKSNKNWFEIPAMLGAGHFYWIFVERLPGFVAVAASACTWWAHVPNGIWLRNQGTSSVVLGINVIECGSSFERVLNLNLSLKVGHSFKSVIASEIDVALCLQSISNRSHDLQGRHEPHQANVSAAISFRIQSCQSSSNLLTQNFRYSVTLNNWYQLVPVFMCNL